VTPRDRRAAMLGVAVVGAACLGLREIPRGVRQWRDARERLESQRILLTETRTALEALPRMEDSAKALTPQIAELAPRILAGSTAPVALSDLSGRLASIAGLLHARLVRFDPANDSTSAGPLRRVTAVAEVETDFRGVAELLAVLARDTLVTVVERVQLTAADPLALSATPERLDVELRISAWYLARGAGS
jgi:hypothetical protein